MRLEGKIVQLGEEERQHLGREIHDGLCQQLTAALLRCTALHEQLSGRKMTEAAQAQRLRILIQEMLDGAYIISKGLWPVGPEPDALVPALQAMAQRISNEFDLHCEFHHEGEIEGVDGQTAMHLYRIAQEGAANAIKHARASRIRVLLKADAAGILLSITDDGCGLPGTAKPRNGMGLSIMAHRARSIGGKLAITRAEGGGTLVSCRIDRRAAQVPEGASGGH
jgi:signal transduction histidine kinase